MIIVSPREWRQHMRAETRRMGWTHRRMRREMKRAGVFYGDPWRVRLPVVGCDGCRVDFSGLFGIAEAQAGGSET